jgi:hypothetical protein
MSYICDIPKTWTHTFWGVLDSYISPSKNQWIRHGSGPYWDWYMNGKTGTAETINESICAMAKLGLLEGEFE